MEFASSSVSKVVQQSRSEMLKQKHTNCNMHRLKWFSIAILVLILHQSGASKCSGFRANPSVYNFEIGGRPAKVISDGRLFFQVEEAYNAPAAIVRRAFRLNFQSESPIVFDINILYVDLGDRKLLFNTGNSFLSSGTSGFLFDNLNVEGIDRYSITDIFIDHAHFDHIAGLLLPDGKTIAFPNANVHIDRKEWDFWLQDEVNLDRLLLPDASKKFLVNTAKNVLPRVRNRVKFFNGSQDLLGGRVVGVPTYWHTPGHTSFRIKVNGEELLYTGDAIGIE